VHWLSLAFVAIASTATTCGVSIQCEVSGSIPDGVSIRVEVPYAKKPPLTVHRIAIGELHGDEVWVLEGKSRLLDGLTYGESVPGLKAKVGPHPLKPDTRYYVSISGETARWPAQTGYGTCTFGTRSGKVFSPVPIEPAA